MCHTHNIVTWVTKHVHMTEEYLGGRFGYFLFFFFPGEGNWECEAPGRGGVGFLLKFSEGGGCPKRGGGGRGAGRVFAGNSWTLRAQILKKFKILKFSSELEIFKRATHQTPIFCGEFWRSGLKISSDLEIFKRSWKFQAILNFFKIWALREVQTVNWP